MTPADRLTVGIMADLLDRGRSIDALASGLTVAATLIALLIPAIAGAGAGHWDASMWLLLATIVLGLAGKYIAVRVAFDAALLHRCASEQVSGEAFDSAMRSLDLLAATKTGRSWIDRCLGARKLLKLQAMLLVAQSFALAIAIVAAIQH